ncbi:formate dehydrogenase accessory sulfurtransferase FdhD [Chloroflexota bacterium]
MEVNSLETVEYTKVNAGVTKDKERIVREIGLSISINQRHFTTAMIMPVMDKEFIIGYLFGQGFINDITEIGSITIKDNIAQVSLPEKKEKTKTSPTIHSGLKVRRENIFNCVKAILKSEVFAETEAVHSAGLFLHGAEPVCIAEDIGRHNALDKVTGYGLLHNIDFSDTVAASTGRQPSEMILRCRQANIPIIATKGVPTTLAIDLARKAGITIAGLVRGNTMTVYSNPDRIA